MLRVLLLTLFAVAAVRPGPAEIKTFTKAYMRTMKNYKPYNVVFNTSYPPEEASKILYNVVYMYATQVGLPDDQATSAAQGVQQATANTFGKLTPCMFGMVYGMSIGNYTNQNGAVTSQNARQEGMAYGALSVGVFQSKQFPNSIQSLSGGFTGYIFALNLFSSDRVNTVGQIFGDTLYSVAATNPKDCR